MSIAAYYILAYARYLMTIRCIVLEQGLRKSIIPVGSDPIHLNGRAYACAGLLGRQAGEERSPFHAFKNFQSRISHY